MSKKSPKRTVPSLFPMKFKPLTKTQEKVFSSYDNGQHLLLHGYSGTGKSFLALYLAMDDIFNYEDYKRVYIIRSVVESRKMGYLPGSPQDKSKVFETPYIAICHKIFRRDDAYQVLKLKKEIIFETTSFLRGTQFDDAIVIVDEIQNMQFHELATIITRAGRNCKFIFSGDFRQTDFQRDDEKTGLFKFMRIVKRMPEFDVHDFGIDDIVRSELVKSFIVQMEAQKYEIATPEDLHPYPKFLGAAAA